MGAVTARISLQWILCCRLRVELPQPPWIAAHGPAAQQDPGE